MAITYTYQCQSCKEVTEVKQRITEDPLKVCNTCQGELKKIIQPGNFVLKGKWFKNEGEY